MSSQQPLRATNAGAIDWAAAEKVARRLVTPDYYSTSYLRDRFDAQCADLATEAEQFVANDSGLSIATPVTLCTIDRLEWVRVNMASLRRLISPLLDKMSERRAPLLAPKIAGAQVGALLAWMSSRVLGQYDPLLDPSTDEPQDVVYLVVPNVMSLERRFAFPPEQFRLWIAVHECTHRAQFAGVPWMTMHFRGLVTEIIESSEDMAKDVPALISRATDAAKRMRSKDGDQGIFSAISTPEQLETLHAMQGMMALFEGHAEVVMSRAAGERIPDAERFHRVLDERRKSASGLAKIVQRLLGMEAKMKQYSDGAAFVRAVETAGGIELFTHLWDKPDNLPSHEDIRKPAQWIERHHGDA